VTRIVSLLPAATEIAAALGLMNDIVGVSHECDFSNEAKTRPRVTRGALRLVHWGKTGEAGCAGEKLPSAAALNMRAQESFKLQGSGDNGRWDLAFEHGYEEGFKKTHPAPGR
jgi:hypothetical protein